MPERTCPICQAQHQRRGIYCGSRCAKCAENAKRGGWDPTSRPMPAPYDCVQCGARCTPGENVVAHATRFCGQACKRYWHHIHVDGRLSRRDRRRDRAAAKLAEAAIGKRGTAMWVDGLCCRDGCDRRFIRNANMQGIGYCSRECLRKMIRKRYRAKHGHPGHHRDRARKYGVAYTSIKASAIFERDGYRCRICRKRTNRTAKVPHPKAPTLDHIVPMSKGGPHIESNVQCACFECNWRKADGAADDQLLLIG